MTLRMFALALAALSFAVSAQDYITPVRTDLIPPSPQSAAVVEQQMPRPSLLTGAVDFSLPVYTIEVDGYSLPISLRYHTNGIKVYDDPGVLGYGWSLQPALRVTRTIMGRPDETADNVAEQLSNRSNPDLVNLAYKCMNYWIAEDNWLDSQPDIFTFSLPSIQFSRVLDKSNGKFEFLGVANDEYKIDTDSNLRAITVTDPNGIKYIFGNNFIERAQLSNNAGYHIITWLLESIQLPSSRKISFTWAMCEKNFSASYSGGLTLVDCYGGASIYFPDNDFTLSNTLWTSESPYLSSFILSDISFPGGHIDFNYNQSNEYRQETLNTISVSNSSNRCVRKASISYLDNHKEYMPSEICLSGEGKYSFSYNSQRFYNKYGVDWWGYYNGKNNLSMTPPICLKSYTTDFLPNKEVWTDRKNNRDIDTVMMKANILEKIQYPGGGVVDIAYETHRFPETGLNFPSELNEKTDTRFSQGGGLRVKSISIGTTQSKLRPTQLVIYRYDNPVVRAVPNEATFLNVRKGLMPVNDGLTVGARLVDILPVSDYMRYDIGQCDIWYQTVSEIYQEGKVVYHFSDCGVPYNSIGVEYGKRTINGLNRAVYSGPRLIRQETFKSEQPNDYTSVETRQWDYELLKSDKQISAAYIYRDCVQFGAMADYHKPDFADGHKINGESIKNDALISSYPYGIFPYKISLYDTRLREETVTIENSTRSKVTTYESVSRSVPVRISSTHSHGNCDIQIIYPTKGQSSVEDDMIADNQLVTPLHTIKSIGDATLHTKAEYKKVGTHLYRPHRIISWYENTSDTIVSPVYSYDKYGNLIEFTDADNCTASFLYGYDYLYPCCKLEGAGRNSIAQGALLDGNAENKEISVPEGALATKWTFIPLVGLQSIESPQGIKNIYCYDNESRLSVSECENLGKIYTYTYSYDASDGIRVQADRWLSQDGRLKHSVNNKYDGLGRHVSSDDLSARISSYSYYDQMGRLSLTTGLMESKDNDLTSKADIYNHIIYEPSPRNIVTAKTKRGRDWPSEQIKTSVLPGKHVFPLFMIADNTGNIKSRRLPAILSVSTTDEDGISTIKVTDSDENLIFTGRYSSASFPSIIQCHYVYDDRGHLRYILPSNLSAKDYDADDTELLEHAYIYRYDDRDRLVWSKTPGAGPSQFVYTPAGRLVAEHTALLPAGSWRLHLYDRLGREVLTGTASLTDADIEALSAKAYPLDFPTGELPKLYDISTVPGSATFVAEHVTVYDKYPYYSDSFESGTAAGSVRLDRPSGLKTFEVDVHTDGDYHTVTHHYSKLGQLIQSIESGSRHSLTRSLSYNYAGSVAVEESRVYDYTTSKSHTLALTYSYDNAERIACSRIILAG
ncbi:MAG: hypothetical protein NC418_09235, partial [Muribaculaceae bacterium]|nr:hypothetical protein [Muribaculaceae bacterium]